MSNGESNSTQDLHTIVSFALSSSDFRQLMLQGGADNVRKALELALGRTDIPPTYISAWLPLSGSHNVLTQVARNVGLAFNTQNLSN